jgi:hypothetical protein
MSMFRGVRGNALADETLDSSVEGAVNSMIWNWSRFCVFTDERHYNVSHRGPGGCVETCTNDSLFTTELAELHDSSVALFVTLPVFRSLLATGEHLPTLVECQDVLADHLRSLDQLLAQSGLRHVAHDSTLTATLFTSLQEIQLEPISSDRDDQILEILRLAHVVLLGSCGFAMRYARMTGMQLECVSLQHEATRLAWLAWRFAAQTARPRSGSWSGQLALA